MSGETTTPAARRVRRPGWRDPRLGVGVLLVAASVALGAWAVGGAGDGTPVYAAREVLTPGEVLTADRLVVVTARLPEPERYLSADGVLPAGAVATRLVGHGELVPLAAVGSPEDVAVRPVGVPVAGPLGSSVVTGAVVDLWVTGAEPGRTDGSPVPPALVAADLRVSGVADGDGLFVGAATTVVDVLVPQDALEAVLAALAGEGDVTLGPQPGRS